MAGISDLQGGHQLAQKLINTGLPRKSDNLNDSPPNDSKLKSGARNPSCGAGISPRVVLPCGAALTQIQAAHTNNTRIDDKLQLLMVNLFISEFSITTEVNKTR